MKKHFTYAATLLVITAVVVLSGCTSVDKTMKSPNNYVEFTKNDFTLSNQLSATATSTKIINIDWDRLFLKETGTIQDASMLINIASIPVIGNYLSDYTANYALYNLMTENEGYDVVFYPQYETKVEKPVLGLGFIMKKTTVTVSARLGKLK